MDRAPWGYLALLVAAYASAAAAIWLRLVPWTVSLVFLAAPVGLWAFAVSYRWTRRREDGPAGRVVPAGPQASLGMVPAMGANVACLLLTGALLCTGYLLGGPAL